MLVLFQRYYQMKKRNTFFKSNGTIDFSGFINISQTLIYATLRHLHSLKFRIFFSRKKNGMINPWLRFTKKTILDLPGDPFNLKHSLFQRR